MTLVMVLLVIAVVAGVAAVVSGAVSGGLDDPEPQIPVRALPAGPLTGVDVDELRFVQAFRGYRMDQVDAAMDGLAAEIDRLRALLPEGVAERDLAGREVVAAPELQEDPMKDDEGSPPPVTPPAAGEPLPVDRPAEGPGSPGSPGSPGTPGDLPGDGPADRSAGTVGPDEAVAGPVEAPAVPSRAGSAGQD